MNTRAIVRNAVIGLAFCMVTLLVQAQSQTVASSQPPLPPSLQLHAVQGKANIYQDAFGQTYMVNPDSGGSLCDTNGCMVQVCNGGACTYYYCTVVKCTQVSIPQASSKAVKKES